MRTAPITERLAKVGDMMRERTGRYDLVAADFALNTWVAELAHMTPEARLGALTNAPEDQLLALAELLVDRLRAVDWTQRLQDAHAPDISASFAAFADAHSAIAALAAAEITLVFTSHPSELRPPGVLVALCQADVDASDQSLAAILRTITEQLRRVRPTVADEVDFMLKRAEVTIYDALAAHVIRLRAAFETRFGPTESLLPLPLRFHTWVGGDRDGNPAVTAAVILEAGRNYQASVRNAYLQWLQSALKQAANSAELCAELQRLVNLFANEATSASEIHRALAQARTLARTTGASGIESTLYSVSVLFEQSAFSLLALEVRENSAIIMQADNETQQAQELNGVTLTPATRDFILALRNIAELRRHYGPRAVPSIIISNCEDSRVLFALKRLAQACGIYDTGAIALVPLLESIDAVTTGPQLVRELFASDFFDFKNSNATDRSCEIMLGYSDAAKDGGRLMADECIRRAQSDIATVCLEHGATARIFHGRGGTPARGQATIAESFADLQAPVAAMWLKQTEQGEVVANRYGHPLLAAVNFDLWLCEALAHARPQPAVDQTTALALAQRLANDAFAAYRLLRNDVNFLAHIMAVTPLLTVCRMPLSSRPAARIDSNAGAPFTLERLRAIPLNLAANVAHFQMPAWYGTGRALAQEIGTHGASALRQAYRDYAPLRASLNRAARALAATDFSYARERADLSGSDQLNAFVLELEAEAQRLTAGLLLLGIAIPPRVFRDESSLVFHALQRALYRRTRLGISVSFELDVLVVAAAVAEIGMSG